MSRTGTCRHSWQVQEVWRIPMHRQPHEPAETHEVLPEMYTCEWLAQHEPLPPTVKRWSGGFDIRDGDCEACPHYEPAAAALTKSNF